MHADAICDTLIFRTCTHEVKLFGIQLSSEERWLQDKLKCGGGFLNENIYMGA